MANKQATVNIYSLLQQEDSPVAAAASSSKAGPAQPVPGATQTPAERAAARAKANAEKDAAKEAAKQRADADAAAAALLGPLDGFVTQKSATQKKAEKDAQKKLSRQDYEKSAKDGQSPDVNKTRKDGDRKPREAGSFGDRKPGARDGQPRRDNHHTQVGTGNRPPKRDGFDKHSAGKTPKHFQNKKGGDGAANWGNPVADASKGVTETSTPGWGDEGEPKTQTETQAEAGWGDEGEPKQAEETQAEAPVAERPQKPQEAAWDDEGFGKMTLQEYQEKVAAAKAAELAAKLGKNVERRTVEPVDLSKFVEKDAEEEKFLKKAGQKKEKKAAAAAARSGETPLALHEVFALNRGGRGGGGPKRAPRPDADAERPPRGDGEKPRGGGANRGRGGNKLNPKAFPELAPKPQNLK